MCACVCVRVRDQSWMAAVMWRGVLGALCNLVVVLNFIGSKTPLKKMNVDITHHKVTNATKRWFRFWCVIHVHVSLGACPKRDRGRIVGSGKRYIHTCLLHTHIILLCLIILHTYAPHPPPTPRIYLFILQQVGTVLQ